MENDLRNPTHVLMNCNHNIKFAFNLILNYIFPLFSYQMMFTCWNDDPKLRPTFAELAQDINRFITESKEFGTLVINVLNRKQR